MAKISFNVETGVTHDNFDTVTFFGTGGLPATKTFTWVEADQAWSKTDSYTSGKKFRANIRKIGNLMGFYSLLKKSQDQNLFFIHGETIPGINLKEEISRIYRDNRNEAPTLQTKDLTIVAFDIDGWIAEDGEECTPEYFLSHHMPPAFSQADHIVQYSSSHGLVTGPRELKCHFFFWLETPVALATMATWSKAYNAKKALEFEQEGKVHKWDKTVDRAIYTPTQPIYTQKRICIGKEDPIDPTTLLYYVKKQTPTLQWIPEAAAPGSAKGGNLLGMGIGGPVSEEDPPEIGGEGGNLQGLDISPGFDFSQATKELTNGEELHLNINGIALSLVNDGLKPDKIVGMIQGLMEGVANKDERWQERYDDIERSVDTAVEIGADGAMTWAEFETWVDVSSNDQVRMGFAEKLIEFDEMQQDDGIALLIQTLQNASKTSIKKMMNRAVTDRNDARRKRAQEMSKQEREASGIREMVLTGTNTGEALKFIGKALATSDKKPKLFRYGTGSIVKIVDGGAITPSQMLAKSKAREGGGVVMSRPKMHTVTDDLGEMRALVENNVVLINEKGVEVPCPDQILRSIPTLESKHAPFDVLTGLIQHPYIDSDFKYQAKSGYDRRSGLNVIIQKGAFKFVDFKTPQRAYEYLAYTVFDEFPFDTDLDRACAVALLMSAIQRPVLAGETGMPGFAMISPKPSSGKTTIIQIVHHAVYGIEAPTTTWSNKDEEMGKTILSILSTNAPCALFDNIPKGAAIRSDELAKAMTSGIYSGRILGGNNIGEFPSSCLWTFTGNNIRLTGDFSTRVLPCMIVPDMENPETRTFARGNMGEWVARNRSKIISAALIIIAAGAGLKNAPQDKGTRFKEWNRMIRRPLKNASGFDLTDLFKRSAEQDNAGGDVLSVLENFVECFGSGRGNAVKTKNIWDMMNGIGTAGNMDVSGEGLKDSIETNAGGDVKNQSGLAKELSGMVKVKQGDMSLIKIIKHNQAYWMVQKGRDSINEDLQR